MHSEENIINPHAIIKNASDDEWKSNSYSYTLINKFEGHRNAITASRIGVHKSEVNPRSRQRRAI